MHMHMRSSAVRTSKRAWRRVAARGNVTFADFIRHKKEKAGLPAA